MGYLSYSGENHEKLRSYLLPQSCRIKIITGKELILKQARVIPDDLADVMELADKIEDCISEVLDEQDKSVAMAALMSASINAMSGLCDSDEEVIYYRNFFKAILDVSI